MPRRTHRKSRNGCRECKRRHVKCDETRPVCSNCTASERTCEYEDRIWIVERSRQSTTHSSRTSPERQNPERSTAPPAVISLASEESHDSSIIPPVNITHIRLFHHLMTEAILIFSQGSQSPMFPSVLMDTCLSCPYVVNQMLALSALHLSIKHRTQPADSSSPTDPPNSNTASPSDLHPESDSECNALRHQAAQLQTHALAIFNSLPELRVTPENCVPLFIFASFLALHMLCDTLIYRHTNSDTFDHFLDRFVHYLRLHRGVRSIIDGAWPMLRESPLKPLVQGGETRFGQFSDDENLAPPCEKLWSRIQALDTLNEDTLDAYRVTIKMLQLAMNVAFTPPPPPPPPPSSPSSSLPSRPPSSSQPPLSSSSPSYPPFWPSHGEKLATSETGWDVSGAMSWPVLLSPEYIDLLERRRPEALVILAFYAVLLHAYRGYWCFGDGGRFLIVEIGQYLGEEWKEWLEWPNEVLNTR